MSVTFSIEVGTLTVECNHNNVRACCLMERAGLDVEKDLCGVIKHEELLFAIKNLLNVHQEAKASLEAYLNQKPNNSPIPFSEAEYYEHASQGLLGLFSLAYTLGKDVHYS